MKGNYHIMLVEDDENLAYLVSEQLREQQFDVSVSHSAEEAMNVIGKERIDLYVLDVVLPEMDGISLAKKIKKQNDEVPIVFLTSRNLKSDIVLGYEIGADDYITKPFDIDLFVMRLNVILSRCYGQKSESQEFKMGEVNLDPLRKILSDGKEEIKFSGTECEIVKALLSNGTDPLSREDIMIKVWGREDYFLSKNLDVYISKIRKKISALPLELETIHGFGYSMIQKAS